MTADNKLEEKSTISRRSFLKGTGTLVGGAVAVGAFLGTAKEAEAAAPPVPWPYVALDPEVVRKKGYDGYFGGGCCYGAAKAIVDALVEALPDSPWNTIPVDMFRFGAGGAAGWGTLCGALNGSLAVMSLAAGTKYASIGNELIGWYTTNPFPSTKLDIYSPYPNQIQTVADSPLCHNSVSQWCAAANKTVNSSEKKNRCAKLTGDTAAKVAEFLNQALINNTFAPSFTFDADTQHCMSCHTGTMDNEQGKMKCGECHTPHL